jgi:hypothetical protein
VAKEGEKRSASRQETWDGEEEDGAGRKRPHRRAFSVASSSAEGARSTARVCIGIDDEVERA